MDDLLLFSLLENRQVSDPRLPPLLEALTSLSLVRRTPFFGVLDCALEAESPDVRALALRALGGAEGPVAAIRLVAALDDADLGVRLAAVATLRRLGESQPARLAHAIFHADESVRVAALAEGLPKTAAHYAFFLLVDPACAALVRAPLPGETTTRLPPPPPSGWPAILDLRRKDVLSAADARALVAQLSWDSAAAWLDRSRQRPAALVEAWLAAASRLAGPTRALDPPGLFVDLEELIALFWDESDASAALFGSLARALSAALEPYRKRAIVAMLSLTLRTGVLPARAFAAIVSVFPQAVGWMWLSPHVRRRAISVLYERTDLPRLEDEEVEALLWADICRHPRGGLDLHVVGGLLHLVVNNPYDRLRAWVGTDLILASLLARPDESVAFLTLSDESPHGRPHLLREVWERAPADAPRLIAHLMLAMPLDKLDFVEALHVGDATLVLGAAMELPEAIEPRRADALGDLFGKKIPRADVPAFVQLWLDRVREAPHPLGAATFAALGKTFSADDFVDALTSPTHGLSTPWLRRLVVALPSCSALPFGKELALAHALVHSDDEELRAWAQGRIPKDAPAPEVIPTGVRPIPDDVATAIATAADPDLPRALGMTLSSGFLGVAAALARRPAPSAPSVAVCVALLGAHDTLEAIDRELVRFGSEDEAFLTALDRAMLGTWDRAPRPGLLVHAWLHRWERHGAAFEIELLARYGSFAAGVAAASSLTSTVLRTEMIGAITSQLAIHAYRDRARLAVLVDARLVELLVEQLAGGAGVAAAAGLVFLHRAKVLPDVMLSMVTRVLGMMPDLADATRDRLATWVDARDLPPAPPPPPPTVAVSGDVLARIRASVDLDELAALCLDARLDVVNEAALRLLELGDPGLDRLASLLEGATSAAAVRPLLDSIALWPSGSALDRVRALSRADGRPHELRHRINVGLLERGELSALPFAEAALLAPDEASWFRPKDWERLSALAPDGVALACRVAASAQPHVYLRAVETLLEDGDREAERMTGLRAFLATGSSRMGALRRRAASFLHARGDLFGFPLVAEGFLEAAAPAVPLLRRASARLVVGLANAFLVAGRKVGKESVLFEHLAQKDVDPLGQGEAFELLLHTGTAEKVRHQIVARIGHTPARSLKLRRVAETFAWGVRIGRELTGQLFRVQMIAGKGLGYTRFRETRVFVTPLPILRRERHGEQVVEGLILHELGHHMFHKGPDKEAVWEEAKVDGIFGLLNLVSDEHLERNLRAMDAGFGDRLKRLAAYAFQHAGREITVTELLLSLQALAFPVLSRTKLGVARDPDCVRVDHGGILSAMEREGLAFPRFMRALRMGLGNRHDDPRVERALALFRGGFRHGDMKSLLAVARELRAIFGWEVQLVESFGPHESLEGDEADRVIHGEGISDDDVQGEVERVLDPKKRKPLRDGAEGPAGKAWVNVNPDEAFTPITNVQKVPFDPVAHARYANQVRRAATPMRAYLESLGLRMEPVKMRLSGRAFDRGRTEAMVIRRDPRVLVARQKTIRTDLFLGIVVDCSGSMQSGELLERAKRFAVLLAEASRGLSGIDVRIFGFTDRVIYDAGDAERCAAHGLVSGGGNNDAAALWHAAAVARQSRRRARLLVMISDGLPTECSVAALRAVVTRLTQRERMCVAQVAVRPISEVCFPHYVLLEDGDESAAVRRFGSTIAGLVRRTLSSS